MIKDQVKEILQEIREAEKLDPPYGSNFTYKDPEDAIVAMGNYQPRRVAHVSIGEIKWLFEIGHNQSVKIPKG